MTFHILNGDCIADQHKQTSIRGQQIVCAECLIDGDLSGDTLSEFWESRARFISDSYAASSDEYYTKVVSAFETILKLPKDAEVSLWFENDLFCQANMWFVLSLLNKRPPATLYRVFPVIENPINQWKGFGVSNARQLEEAYQSKVKLSREDLNLGANLWNAYKLGDFKTLKELSRQSSTVFQQLEEVVQAHIDRFPADHTLGRPEKAIKELIEHKSTDFKVVFAEFSKNHGIYGFGDTQVQQMYDRLVRK